KGAAAASVANLVASVTAALERATGAAPVAERIPSAAPALDVSAFAFPKELVPGGVATVEIQADGKWLDKPGLAGTRTGPARAVYKLESGNVLEVHLWSHLDGAPTIDEMSPYRYVWAAEQAVWNGLTGAATSTTYTKPLVALAAPGVPDATVAALAALIRAELETCRPGTLKVLKAVEKASDAPKAKKVAVADLVPTPDELPAGFSMAGYRTNIIQTSWGVDYAEEGEANLDERGTVYVELFRVKASVLDGLAKVKAKALTLGKPVEILVAGDHYIVLIETDPVSTSGRDALVAVLEAKLSAATGLKATRTRVPALYAGFDLSGIRPVTSQLPAGVALGAIEVAAVSSFANANTAEVARYKGGSFEVTLRVLWNRAQSGHDRAIGAPSDAELRPLAAAWLAQWTAVTIETKGEVPAAVLDFFRAHVESELKRFTATRDAKRLEIPKPRLWAAGDLVPQSDELPKFASVEHEARLDARQLRDESANALGGSPTNGPLVAAMNAGARDAVTIHYQESRNREVRFHVRSYESAAQAAAAVVPTRRCAGHYFSSLREVWLVENVVCAVEDYNVSAEGWDALRAALASRAASLGDLRAEARPVTRQLLAFVPYVATHALPRGWKIAENRNAGTPVRSPLGESESSYRCDYSNGTGMVTIVAHVAKVPADPAAGALEGYRGAWLLDDRKSCFTLKVTGEVDAKDRAIFEKHIAAELACSVEGRTAKHLDAAAIAKKVQEDAALDPLDGLQVAQTEKGAFVKSVAKDSRAEKMGFKVGDRITTSGPDHIMVERDGKEIMLRRVE
ncbi:MAG: PDZ domain-containing protein, partial [Planctomycetota bacterium]